MKIMKKAAAVLLAVCLAVPCFSMILFAAGGVIYFTDPETKVGDTFEITGTVKTTNEILGDATVQMSYDTAYLRFVEGDGVNADSDGNLTFTGSGNGSSDKLEFSIKFQALQEGSTRMEQNSATVSTESGESVQCESGFSDITIAEGDPSKIQDTTTTTAQGQSITIGGQEYTISEAFTDMEIPTGFTAGEFTYEGTTYKGVVQERSGLTAAYLLDEGESGKFWLYDTENSTFSSFEEIIISDTYSIIILDNTDDIKLPSEYKETNIDINGEAFSAWCDPDRDEFFIFYAVNSDGEKSLYRYDSLEHTYQRMETPKAPVTASKKAESVMDKVQKILSEYLIWIMVGVGCTLVILLVLLLVVSVKLRHRNLELDDLYDEYGIDEEDDAPAVQPKKKGQFRTPARDETENLDDFFAEDEYDDEYSDEYDDEYDDDDDYYEEDEFADLRESLASGEQEKRNYDAYYDDDDYDDDAAEEAEEVKQSTKDDTFEMDFIDLD